MKYKSVFIATGLAITALMGTSARADEAEDLLNQLAATAEKSGNTTDGSTDALIKDVLTYYRTYLQQINTLANDGDTTAPANKGGADQTATARTDTAKPATASSQSPALQTGNLQTGNLQTGNLQVTGVQPSGPLKEAHLAGYPALPAGPPTSSFPNPPTAAQQHEKNVTDWEQTRIQMYYFEHSGRSPN